MNEKQILNLLMCIVNEAKEKLISNDWGDLSKADAAPLVDTYNKLRKIVISKGWLDNDVIENNLVLEINLDDENWGNGGAIIYETLWAATVLSQFIYK